jgi:hypothetical protein
MSKQFCDISQLIRLIPMDGLVLFREGLIKRVLVVPIDVAEALRHEAEVAKVRALLLRK